MFNFNEERVKVENAAAERFEAENQKPTDYKETKRWSSDRSAAIRKEVIEWFYALPKYASITVRETSTEAEIREEFFGGTISVYRPKADFDWAAGNERSKKIVSGYINASSWEAGSYLSSTREVRQEMLHRMRMMEIALDLLNTYNSVVLDYEEIRSPFRDAIEYKEECERHRQFERARYEEEQKRQEAREARKASKK